jgi:hypothetical protein
VVIKDPETNAHCREEEERFNYEQRFEESRVSAAL